MSHAEYRHALDAAWSDFGDGRSIIGIDDTSPNVSTNSVFRLHLSDGTRVFAKVSNYGSYFLFAEDHDRLFRCTQLIQGTRFENFLAPVLAKSREGFISSAIQSRAKFRRHQTALSLMPSIFWIYYQALLHRRIFLSLLNTSASCTNTLTTF